MSNLRRSMMMAGRGGGEDPYAGWTEGYRLNTLGQVEGTDFTLSPYLSAESDSIVTYYVPNYFTGNSGIWAYNSDESNGAYVGWMTRSKGEHTFTMPTGKTKFRLSFYSADLSYAYIKDANGNYIWKGGNV